MEMGRRGAFALILTVVLAWSVLLYAQQKREEQNPDKKFMMDAAAGGLFEVEAGKIAVRRASSEDVKKFGQRMIDEHSKSN